MVAEFAGSWSTSSGAAVIVVGPGRSETLLTKESLGADQSKTHRSVLDDPGRMAE